MRAGKLRHLVTIQRRTLSRDAVGQQTESWADLGTTWASVMPTGGTEREYAKQLVSETTHKVVMRYFDGLTSKDRIIHNSRTLNIINIINVDERNIEQQIMCKEMGV
ncbi:MAG: phage head closure protein [Planctomycetaceae bacterium]|nr:phage head closure protein [Planctomycetaceae bacterium]